MAQPAPHETPLRQRLSWLWLSGRWGILAGISLLIVAYASITEVGSARISETLATWRGETATARAEPAVEQAYATLDADIGRLTRAVHAMMSERELLLDRISALEQSLDDVTGSITKLAERPTIPSAPPSPVPPSFVLLEPALGLARPPITELTSQQTWAGIPLPRPAQRAEPMHTGSLAPANTAARIQPPQQAQPPQVPPQPAASQPVSPEQERRIPYGVDLGGASSVDGAQALWKSLRTRSNALATLTPAVTRPKQYPSNTPQLRLIAGPLPSAAAAARLCDALMAGRTACHPVVYDGQPLALR